MAVFFLFSLSNLKPEVQKDSSNRSSLDHDRTRKFPTRLFIMGVTVEVITPGDGKTFPQPGQKVTVHYVGKRESTNMFRTWCASAGCTSCFMDRLVVSTVCCVLTLL
jgi:hypothetical protein